MDGWWMGGLLHIPRVVLWVVVVVVMVVIMDDGFV